MLFVMDWKKFTNVIISFLSVQHPFIKYELTGLIISSTEILEKKKTFNITALNFIALSCVQTAHSIGTPQYLTLTRYTFRRLTKRSVNDQWNL